MLDKPCFIMHLVDIVRDFPVALDFRKNPGAVDINRQGVTRFKLAYVLKESFVSKAKLKGQIVFQASGVYCRVREVTSDNRLDLGCTDKMSVITAVVERFDSHPIASAEEPPPGVVPYGESEHPKKPFNAPLPPLSISMKDNLGVGIGTNAVSLGNEFSAQLQVVVNGSVENDRHLAVFGRHGLMPMFRVDDGEPAVAEKNPPLQRRENPLTIRAAMPHGG
jgi:hypothetical protein